MTWPIADWRLVQPERLEILHGRCFASAWSGRDFARWQASVHHVGYIGLDTENQAEAGLVVAMTVCGEAEILTLAVAPEHRRRGLATQLLDALRKRLARDAISRVTLEVASDNHPATRTYKGTGFEPVGRRRNYYPSRSPGSESGGDAIVMALDLARSGGNH